jgi:hypothetical protein
MGTWFNFDKFRLVYWVIAIATAQHTAWGAATTMQGALPTDATLQFGWWLQGIAFAIAIDYSMVMIATKIRTGTNATRSIGFWRIAIPLNWYTIAFIFVAAMSSYFQLLYAWSHATTLQAGSGVAMEWVARLQSLVDARIAIAPFALPAIAILYTFGGFGKGGEVQRKQAAMQSSRNETAIKIEKQTDALPSGSAMRQLPDSSQLRNDEGILVGYVCPGCSKQLSISGWSRHKHSCKQYQVLVETEYTLLK